MHFITHKKVVNIRLDAGVPAIAPGISTARKGGI